MPITIEHRLAPGFSNAKTERIEALARMVDALGSAEPRLGCSDGFKQAVDAVLREISETVNLNTERS